MASLRRLANSQYWIACFTGPDGRRVQRSTKEIDRSRAQKIADRYGEAAHTARLGFLAERQARRVIGDIYAISNREVLPTDTVEDFFTGWLGSKKVDSSPKTFARYSGIISQFFEWLGPRIKLGIQHLSSQDIVHFRDDRRRSIRRPASTSRSAAYRPACPKPSQIAGWTSTKPGRVSRLADDPNKKHQRRAFTDAELRSILKVADQEWKGMTICGVYTGMRLGDISILRWQDVDLTGRELHFKTEKTGREQVIPIAEPLYRYLIEIAGNDDPQAPLFPRAFALRQRDIPTGTLSNQFYRLMTLAGIVEKRTNKSKDKGRTSARQSGGLGFHCLRHTATTLLKRAGASDVVAREIVGHTSAAVSRTYSHIDTATLRVAIDKLPDITSLENEVTG